MKFSQDTSRTALFFLLLIFLFIAVFGPFIFSGSVLMATDPVITGSPLSFVELVNRHFGMWKDWILLGSGAPATTVQLSAIINGFMPTILWNNLVYGIACFLSSIMLWSFLRKHLERSAVFAGLLAAFWVGSNFTLLYAGHISKSYVMFFFVCSLLPVAGAARGSIMHALAWGGCVGLMFIQQPDVALFFALFSGSYLVFSIARKQSAKWMVWLKVLLPAVFLAFLFACGPLLNGYSRHVKGAAQMQTGNKTAKWDYVTQWSFPPNETIDLVSPSYTGIRSGDPEGPYWGRMGRSAGWEQTKQGFRNFKLESVYLGLIPVAFAFFALFSCRRSKHRAEILFWGGAALMALLLSYGKFTPIYKLFYQLPVVNNIRNPNKFLQVFQVCLAILTAYGIDALWRTRSAGGSTDEHAPPPPKWFFGILSGVLALFVLGALSLTLGRSSDIAEFTSQGWPAEAAGAIVQTKIKALWHTVAMLTFLTALFAVFSFSRFGKVLRFKNWMAAALVLILIVDVVKLSKNYVKEMPRSYIEANALTDFLKQNIDHQRVALLNQQGIYGIWTAYLLPFHRIPTFNFADMPRMAIDDKAFLETGQKNPLNMWRSSSVKYLLGPASVEAQLGGQVRKVFAYDVVSDGGTGFKVMANPNGAHAVFELLHTYPRYSVSALIPDSVSDEQALAHVIKAPRTVAGSAEVVSYRPGKVALSVQAGSDSTLRISEKWTKDWVAKIDGQSAEVRRVDFIFQGLDIPAGEHEIVLRYSPPKHFLLIQSFAYLIFFGALGGIGFQRRKIHAED